VPRRRSEPGTSREPEESNEARFQQIQAGSTWSGWSQRPTSSALHTAPGISSRGDGNTVDLFMVRTADSQIDYQQMPQ
jgi:hypothetical protein